MFLNVSKNAVLKKDLFDFLAEMEKNLEIFYVMDQRQFIVHGFVNELWPRVKEIDCIKRHASIEIYVQALVRFNTLFKKHKEYEAWYASDLKNKTPDNARLLHALKEDLDLQIQAMEAIIITAGQDLERVMIQLGFLRE